MLPGRQRTLVSPAPLVVTAQLESMQSTLALVWMSTTHAAPLTQFTVSSMADIELRSAKSQVEASQSATKNAPSLSVTAHTAPASQFVVQVVLALRSPTHVAARQLSVTPEPPSPVRTLHTEPAKHVVSQPWQL